MPKQPTKQILRNEVYNNKGTIFGYNGKSKSKTSSSKLNKIELHSSLARSILIALVLLILAIGLYANGVSENAAFYRNNHDVVINLAGVPQKILALVIGIVAILIGSSSMLNRMIKPKNVKKSTAAFVFMAIIISVIVFLSIAPH